MQPVTSQNNVPHSTIYKVPIKGDNVSKQQILSLSFEWNFLWRVSHAMNRKAGNEFFFYVG